MDQIKFAILTTLKLTVICLAVTILYLAIGIFLGENYSYYFAINPFTSGLIHSGFSHLEWNIFGIFISLNMACNRHYTTEKIFWITSLIAIIYLPLIIIDSEFASVGISGTCYFLLIRGLGSQSRKAIKIFCYFLLSNIIIKEALEIGNTDKIAHSVHFIGSILGLISLYPYRLKFLHDKIYEIIS